MPLYQTHTPNSLNTAVLLMHAPGRCKHVSNTVFHAGVVARKCSLHGFSVCSMQPTIMQELSFWRSGGLRSRQQYRHTASCKERIWAQDLHKAADCKSQYVFNVSIAMFCCLSEGITSMVGTDLPLRLCLVTPLN